MFLFRISFCVTIGAVIRLLRVDAWRGSSLLGIGVISAVFSMNGNTWWFPRLSLQLIPRVANKLRVYLASRIRELIFFFLRVFGKRRASFYGGKYVDIAVVPRCLGLVCQCVFIDRLSGNAIEREKCLWRCFLLEGINRRRCGDILRHWWYHRLLFITGVCLVGIFVEFQQFLRDSAIVNVKIWLSRYRCSSSMLIAPSKRPIDNFVDVFCLLQNSWLH